MKPIFSRGPSLQIRLILAVLVALGVIIADSRPGRSVKSERTWTLPSVLSILFQTALVNCSTACRKRWLLATSLSWKTGRCAGITAKNSDLLMLGQYKQENARLRELLGRRCVRTSRKW